jgi:hypothetical protein
VLNEIVLAKCSRELKLDDRVVLLQSYLCKNLDVHENNVTLKSGLFLEISRKLISMIFAILGKDNDLVVDEFVLGFMASICLFLDKTLTEFNYTQVLANQTYYQLS